MSKIKLLGIIVLTLVMGFAMMACPTDIDPGNGKPGPVEPPPPPPPPPTVAVSKVTVTPKTSAAVEKGSSIEFTATVEGTGDFATTVTWSIVETGKHAQTVIDANGKLDVASAETLAELTVKATSTEDTTKSGTITVYIFNVGQIPTVATVVVSPNAIDVEKGGYQDFTVQVNGTNNPPQDVTWSIVETGKHAGTTISADGRLTVAVFETLAELTVKATSTIDISKSGTAAVTLTDPPGKILTITNISGSITGEMDVILFSSLQPTPTMVAGGSGSIVGGTLTVTLYEYDDSGASGDPGQGGPTGWNGSGEYFVVLEGENGLYIYTNGAAIVGSWTSVTAKYDFSATSPSIAFSLFKEIILGEGGTELTITGLASFEGDDVTVQLVDNWDGDLDVVGFGTIPSGGSITLKLMDTSFEGWTGSGGFWIILSIENEASKNTSIYFYTNGQTLEALSISDTGDLDRLPTYTFDGTNKTIAFGLFKEVDFPSGPSDPVVQSINVTPTNASINLNSGVYTQQFQAEVMGSNLPPNGGGVTWRVDGNQDNGTVMHTDGLLTVAIGETAGSLQVTATSDLASNIYHTVTVDVIAFSGTVPEVTSVEITNKASVTQGNPYQRGASVSISATVSGTHLNSVSGGDDVNWSVSGNNSSSTVITSTGTGSGSLYIGHDETSVNLLVTATSKIASQSDSVSVTVDVPLPAGKTITVSGLGSLANQYVDISIRDDLSNLLIGGSVASGGGQILGSSVTVELGYNDWDDDEWKAWKGSGNYYVVLQTDTGLYIHTNGAALPNPITNAPKVNITGDDTPLVFSDFKEIIIGAGGNTLTITGLSAYNGGAVMAVVVDPTGQSEAELMVAMGNAEVSGNQAAVLLADGSGAGWTGTGQYAIVLNISGNNDYFTYVYSAGGTWESLNIDTLFAELHKLPKYNFTGGNISIDLSQFALSPDDGGGSGDPGNG